MAHGVVRCVQQHTPSPGFTSEEKRRQSAQEAFDYSCSRSFVFYLAAPFCVDTFSFSYFRNLICIENDLINN